jgi:hypothetical protein
MENLQRRAPQQYKNPAVQQHFQDLYRPMAHQASTDLGRANTQASADYNQRATAAQNQSVLGGLQLLNTQQQNAYKRQQAGQDIAYGWMNDMVGGMGNVLGGLL